MTTYWAYCKFEGDEAPWTTALVENKGICAFSSRNFLLGENICIETPLTLVSGHHPFSQHQIEEIEKNVSKLSDVDKSAFYAMANSHPSAQTLAAGIFMTNSFDMTNRETGAACAMYLAIGRLNHSCSPNAQQSHVPETGEEVLYASRDIAKDEELNDCYIDLRQKKSDRQRLLLQDYGFTCQCSACSLDPLDPQYIAEERQRPEALDLENKLLEAAEEGEQEVALQYAQNLVSLLLSPTAMPWSARYIPSAYVYLYHISSSLRMRSRAVDAIREAHRWNLLLQGPLTPDSKRSEQLVRQYTATNQDSNKKKKKNSKVRTSDS